MKSKTCPDCGFVLGTEYSAFWGNPNFCWSNVDPTGGELVRCKLRHWKARALAAESALGETRINGHVFKSEAPDNCDKCGEQSGARWVRECPNRDR